MKTKEKSKTNQILIWTEPSNPPRFEGLVFLWNLYQKSTKEIISVPYELEVNATFFRERYLDFIDKVSNIQIHKKDMESYFRIDGTFSLWWMNLSFEKNYGKSDSFSNSIKLSVLGYYLEGIACSLIQVSESTPIDLVEYLTFCSKKVSSLKQTYIDIFKRFLTPRPIKSILPHFVLGLISIFRYVKFCGGIQFRSHRRQDLAEKLYIYDYFFHLLTKENEKEFRSAYWGTLPNLIKENQLEVTYSHIYVPSKAYPTIQNAKRKIDEFNQTSDSKIKHRLVEQITISVLWQVIYHYFKFSFIYLVSVSFRFKSLLLNQELRPSLYLWNELKDSLIGSIAVQNLFTYFTIKNQVETASKGASLVYLMENQNWEKVLVYHWKKIISKKIYAVTHATVRFWDLRYSFRMNLSGYRTKECKPEKIVYNGPLSKKGLLEFGYKEEDLVPGEALRFLGLETLQTKRNQSKQNRIFLVFTDYLFAVSKFQLELLESLHLPYRIIVKPHPACPIDKSDFPNLNFEISMEPSETLLKIASIVFTSNVTSAALEAYYLGLPVISARDPKEVNLSPLFGVKDVHFVSSKEELKKSIQSIEKVGIRTKRNLVFFTNSNLENWKKILSSSRI
ncbi:TIGR04326 family surface carbohydrate biosynthesis protein [Leptospira paudalimensis]|uniref:Uncharacterized protein n=1 Tax=Leptospira paudalimensis TaxID=2950024 RepID=A0ABT3M5R7_9LEPT|nr:TIGR04326 family surface carbohydrate biosynthesis protein [Leptospira paudalimensis]MCW7503736.1 hypothetical protein [Leptospira paudalimensis]